MPQMTATFFGSDGANGIVLDFSNSTAGIEAALIPRALLLQSVSFDKISSRELLRVALHACRPDLLPGLTQLDLSNQNPLLNFHKLTDNITLYDLASLCTWINPLSRLSQLRELRIANSVQNFSETKQSSTVLASLFCAVFQNFPQLQLLDVTGIPFCNDGIIALCATLSQLRQLRSFVCGDVRLKIGDSNQSRPRPILKSQSDASVLYVLASMLPPSLLTLDIQSNELHLVHAIQAAPLMFHCNLTSINVSNCCMNDSDLILLISFVPNAIANLRTLSCSRNKDIVFKDPALLELFGSLSSLTSISLAHSGIDNTAAIMLSRCFMKLTRLQEVDMSHLIFADHVAACNLAGALMTLPQCVRFTATPHSSMISTFVISRRGSSFALDNGSIPSTTKKKRRAALVSSQSESWGGGTSPLSDSTPTSFASLFLKSSQQPSTPECANPHQLRSCSLDELAIELQCVSLRIRHLGNLLRNENARDLASLVLRQLALFNEGGRLLAELALLVKCRRQDLNSNVFASPGTPVSSSSRRMTPELTEPSLQLRLLEQARLHMDKANFAAAACDVVVEDDLVQLQLHYQLWCSNFEGVKAAALVMERKVFWWMYGLRHLPCQQQMCSGLLENKRSPLSVIPDIIQDGLKSNLMALKWIYSTQKSSHGCAPSRIAIFVEGPSDVQFLDALMSSHDSLKLLRRCEIDEMGETVLKYASPLAELRFFESKLQCAADLKQFAFQWGNFFGVGADDVASVLLPAGCRVVFMHDGDVLPDIGLLSDDNGSILHRHWRWGRAIENYLVPADWLLHNTSMAHSLLCELLVTITKRFFFKKSDLSVWNNPCAAAALASIEVIINSIPADDLLCSVSVRERPDACVKLVTESLPDAPARIQAASWLLSLQDALLCQLYKADGCGSSLSKLLFPCTGCDACPGMIVRLSDIQKGYNSASSHTCMLCSCPCSRHAIPPLESAGANSDVLRKALENLLAGCNSHSLMTAVTGKPTHATCTGHTAKLSADDINTRRDAHTDALLRTLAEEQHSRCKELLEVRVWLHGLLM